jgi:hypothetical protein
MEEGFFFGWGKDSQRLKFSFLFHVSTLCGTCILPCTFANYMQEKQSQLYPIL